MVDGTYHEARAFFRQPLNEQVRFNSGGKEPVGRAHAGPGRVAAARPLELTWAAPESPGATSGARRPVSGSDAR